MVINEIKWRYIGSGNLTQSRIEKLFGDDGTFAGPMLGYINAQFET